MEENSRGDEEKQKEAMMSRAVWKRGGPLYSGVGACIDVVSNIRRQSAAKIQSVLRWQIVSPHIFLDGTRLAFRKILDLKPNTAEI